MGLLPDVVDMVCQRREMGLIGMESRVAMRQNLRKQVRRSSRREVVLLSMPQEELLEGDRFYLEAPGANLSALSEELASTLDSHNSNEIGNIDPDEKSTRHTGDFPMPDQYQKHQVNSNHD